MIVALLALAFLVGTPLLVQGQSMEPNFHSSEMVFVDRLSYFNQEIDRGDVVAAIFPADPKKTRLIKRVIGLPGETVTAKAGKITVNGKDLPESYQPILGEPPYVEVAETKLGPGKYFLVGDNRPGSSDSRLWGPVAREDITGRVRLVLFPLGKIRFITDALY